MRNCTKHFLERWVERIVGITTEKERNEYINQNRDMLIENANVTFEYSQFIYKGQIGDNITRNYYIKDDIVYVTNTSDDAFITIYKVDLGFPDKLNTTVRKGLMDEIKRLTFEKEELELEILMEIENKQHTVSSLSDSIKNLEEQLDNLKRQRRFVEEEIKFIKTKSANTGLELGRYTMMLVNSKEYKKDLTTMK